MFNFIVYLFHQRKKGKRTIGILCVTFLQNIGLTELLYFFNLLDKLSSLVSYSFALIILNNFFKYLDCGLAVIIFKMGNG